MRVLKKNYRSPYGCTLPAGAPVRLLVRSVSALQPSAAVLSPSPSRGQPPVRRAAVVQASLAGHLYPRPTQGLLEIRGRSQLSTQHLVIADLSQI